MCKRLAKEGEFFIKISNMGVTDFSVGYDCMHIKTVEILFFRLVDTFTELFYKNSQNEARAYLANLLFESFDDRDKALELAKEILTKLGVDSKDIFKGLATTHKKKNNGGN